MTEIKLTKRYPQSRTEDIVDAYMRGWNDALDAVQNGKFHINEAEQTEPNCSEIPNNSKVSEIPTGSEKPNNCEPQTEEHCETCRHKDECESATYEYKNAEWWCLAYAPIDEPQTDCDHRCVQTEVGCELTDCAWK